MKLNKTKIMLRKAEMKDLLLLYDWVNEAEVRKNSITTDRISLDQHTVWFNSRIKNKNTAIFLGLIEKRPFGQVRFEINEDSNVYIDYSIEAGMRGRGLGSHILKLGVEEFIQSKEHYSPWNKITGIVKVSNLASIRVFKSLEFQAEGQEKIGDDLFEIYTYQQ